MVLVIRQDPVRLRVMVLAEVHIRRMTIEFVTCAKAESLRPMDRSCPQGAAKRIDFTQSAPPSYSYFWLSGLSV
jgi:hypothetical protein